MRYIREKFGKKSTVCASTCLRVFIFLLKALQPLERENRNVKKAFGIFIFILCMIALQSTVTRMRRR